MNGHHIDLDTTAFKKAAREMRGDEAKPDDPVVWRAGVEHAATINLILNDPSVFPLISIPEQGPFDIGPLLADPRNVFLMAEGGVIICVPDPEPTSGIYEIHMNFLPDHRGRQALDAAAEACRYVFTHTPCMTIVTRVPRFNEGADLAARQVGGRLWFTRKAGWPVAGGEAADVKFYTLTLQEWSVRYPEKLIEAGRAFHARLEQEYERHQFVRPPHPDDDAHDLAVGLASEMMYGGEPEKAVIIYNRWARLAGYVQANLISRNPLVIDMGEALLQVLPAEKTFKVIQCRLEQQ